MTKEFLGYAFHKTLATGFIDMALLLANVSQLKILTDYDMSQPTFRSIFTTLLVVMSILLQVLVGLMLIYLGTQENRELSTSVVVVAGQNRTADIETPTHKRYIKSSTSPATFDILTQSDISSQLDVKAHTPDTRDRGAIATGHGDSHTFSVERQETAHVYMDETALDDVDAGVGVDDVDVGVGIDDVDAGVGVDDVDAGVDGGIIFINGTQLSNLVGVQGSRETFQSIQIDNGREENSLGHDTGGPCQTQSCMQQHSRKNARVMCCVFIIMIINILISGLGFSNNEHNNYQNTNGTS